MIVREPPPERVRNRTGRPEERLGLGHRGGIETAGERPSRAALRRVVRARHARERVEHDHDVLAALHETVRAIEHHLGDFDVPLRGLVEARRNDFAHAPRDGLAHFLGTLVDEEDEQRRVGMVDRDAFGDAVQQRRLAGARRRDDQRALAVADRRDQIDRAANELRARLRRTPGLHEQLALGVRRGERVELGTLGRQRRIDVVDRSDLDDRRTAALIEADRRVDEVRLAKHELADDLGRDVRVAGFGEVAVAGAPDESRVARGVEPPPHLARRDELNRLRRMLLLLRLLLVLSAAGSTAFTALTATAAAPVTSSAVASVVEPAATSASSATTALVLAAVAVLVLSPSPSISAWRVALVSGPTAASSALLIAAGVRRGRGEGR